MGIKNPKITGIAHVRNAATADEPFNLLLYCGASRLTGLAELPRRATC